MDKGTDIGKIPNLNMSSVEIHKYFSSCLRELEKFANCLDAGAYNGINTDDVVNELMKYEQNAVDALRQITNTYRGLMDGFPRVQRRRWGDICDQLEQQYLRAIKDGAKALLDFLRTNSIEVPDRPA